MLHLNLCNKSLRMKSKAYYGLALEEGSNRVGIVMFESLFHGILVKDKILSISQAHSGYLIEMIKRTREVNAIVTHQNQGK